MKDIIFTAIIETGSKAQEGLLPFEQKMREVHEDLRKREMQMELELAHIPLLSFNPATGKNLETIFSDTEYDVFTKVKRARSALDAWSLKPLMHRLQCIRRVHDIIAQDAGRTSSIISMEIGRPLQETLGAEILPTLLGLDFLCRRAQYQLKPIRTGKSRAAAHAEPYGVIGIIGTWNYPLLLNLISICQALAAGNTVVWKPSELAIQSAQEIERILDAAGFPTGTIEIIYGNADIGKALTKADCDKYVFTGSVRTGRAILQQLALNGKPSVMELSGNDAFIVCADADVDLAARSAVWGRISNAGQSCVAPQRFYVSHAVYEPFLERVKTHLQSLQPHELTPLRTAEARQRCHKFVREAVEHGAELLFGGDYDLDRPGYFYTPTLLSECEDSMPIMAEDLFGPVIAVCPVYSDWEAAERTNSNALALGASIWTNDMHRAATLASKLKVGMVSVNEVLLDAANPEYAFGGLRASGFGKLRGLQGLEEFVVRKVVSLHLPVRTKRHLFPYHPAAAKLLTAAAKCSGANGWRNIPALIQSAIQWNRQSRAFNKSGANR